MFVDFPYQNPTVDPLKDEVGRKKTEPAFLFL